MLLLWFGCVFGQEVMALKYGQGRMEDISILAAVINPMEKKREEERTWRLIDFTFSNNQQQ